MADARSLLRAQRAARRINHPHASYTDSGKLTCAVCREPIKSDAQWEVHVRGVEHRQRLLARQRPRAAPQAPEPTDDPSVSAVAGSGATGKSKPGSTDTPTDEALLAQIISGGGAGQKRKHSADEDEGDDVEMADGAPTDDAARPKRSKHDMTTAVTAASSPAANGSPMKIGSPDVSKSSSKTPPGLTRRMSGTPSHGVEIQFPSRPATPSASATSATSTPKATPMGRSPLIPQDAQLAAQPATSKPAPKAAFVTPTTTTTTTTTTTERIQNATAAPPVTTPSAAAAAANEDDDWAAFEAEVVHAAPAPATTNPIAAFANDAVISAAPLTAEQLAAKSEEEERDRRRMQADVDIEDEREEATRALEAEFEEMEELEARVRKLKEKREAIRRGSVAGPSGAGAAPDDEVPGQHSQQPANGTGSEERDEDEDEEDDDEEDGWAGFRFRA